MAGLPAFSFFMGNGLELSKAVDTGLSAITRKTMTEAMDPKQTGKSIARCSECDREMNHYNTFVSPGNEERVICWECLSREEKGFNAKRDFSRQSRSGIIPR